MNTVVSVFAIVILTVLAIVYRSGHEEFVGGTEDPTPEEGVAISGTIFTAVFVYLGFFVFCGCQGMLHEVVSSADVNCYASAIFGCSVTLAAGSLELEFFAGGDVPRYAILSHTWEAGEVTFQELQSHSYNSSSQGWIKIQRSAQLAATQELMYIWIDTCCIDKSSSAELSEAINSMFQWYEQAYVCYVYLSDVAAGQEEGDFTSTSGQGNSRWFSRGWTLQELIAPCNINFYNRDWQMMGHRDTLNHAIHKITRIPYELLFSRPAGSGRNVSHELALIGGHGVLPPGIVRH
ncbi:hypothetical protein NLG97_g10711 [Lecanicillium saksenae]|uniref:Uncharacterized protein n=1 Tax=Lecanicillium saksenae TaxID=468837 RepID=A0ACC1QCZ1_9HYPO|nr:hypothetical protein NLG97_g10711 [Lecanicillium saksenae]